MVSIVVLSLLTAIPVKDCIEIVKRKLNENKMAKEYAELLEWCLPSDYLLRNDEFYMQVDGMAMGSPVSPLVADTIMEAFRIELWYMLQPCCICIRALFQMMMMK